MPRTSTTRTPRSAPRPTRRSPSWWGTSTCLAHLVERGRRCRIRQAPARASPAAPSSRSTPHTSCSSSSWPPAGCAGRWSRCVVTAHLAAEYAPVLAWQRFLGHAGDPLELEQNPAFAGPQSHWGRYDDSNCPHTRPQRSAAARTLRVMHEPPSGWRNYIHQTTLHCGLCPRRLCGRVPYPLHRDDLAVRAGARRHRRGLPGGGRVPHLRAGPVAQHGPGRPRVRRPVAAAR